MIATSESDSSSPDPLEQFEQDMLEAFDPGVVFENYRTRYPALAETLEKLAETMAMLLATPLRHTGARRASQAGGSHPARFGPYKVLSPIGRGGMGEVYKAFEEPLGRVVAIKALPLWETRATARDRFHRERRTLALLHHNNVVPIYATGTEGDLISFAMPYLFGASLGQVIRTARSHELSEKNLADSSFEKLVQEAHSRSQAGGEDQEGESASTGTRHLLKGCISSAVQVLGMIAEGLQQAHQKGIIHRDVKPANIIVEMNGHAWVLDFGLASMKGTADGSTVRPVAFSVHAGDWDSSDALTRGPLWTEAYMAPEQHADGRHADNRSDV